MSHPSLGLPPADATAGNPGAAQRLRAAKRDLGARALEAAIGRDPTLAARYDAIAMRTFLRDYDRHVEQLARALETGQERFVVQYAEWLVPVYRHRHVPMHDCVLLLGGLRDAALGVLTRDDATPTRAMIDRWVAQLRRHERLAGDHAGNPAVRFVWKGVGIADDSVV